VFVNAGDIVKGGRQDRYLVNSLIVPPKSGKIDLASFCVEAGRWSQRGRESAAHFSASKFTAPSSEIKLAAQYHMNQQRVWNWVAQSRAFYRIAITGGSAATTSPQVASNPTLPGIPGNPNPTVVDPVAGLPVAALRALEVSLAELPSQQAALSTIDSSSSLQLALENPKVQELVKEYADHMDRQLATQKNPVGFAVAINGKVVSADIYGQANLFKALWPKLINGAATEAVAKYDKNTEVKRLKQADFEAFLTNGKQESSVNKTLNEQTRLLTTKGDRHILFETHDKRDSSNWIHRSYLAAPKK